MLRRLSPRRQNYFVEIPRNTHVGVGGLVQVGQSDIGRGGLANFPLSSFFFFFFLPWYWFPSHL